MTTERADGRLNPCLFFGALAAAAVAVSVFVEAPIIAVSGDGAYYLCYAHSIASGTGFHDCWNGRLTGQTPLFPMLLAIPLALGLDTVDAVRIFCIVLAGGAAYFAARTLAGAIHSNMIFWLAALTLSLQPALILWSTVGTIADPYFAGFSVLLICVGMRHLRRPDSALDLALLAGAALICVATRYWGVALVASACLAMVMPVNPRRPFGAGAMPSSWARRPPFLSSPGWRAPII